MAASTSEEGTTTAGGGAGQGASGQDMDPARLEAACAAADVHPLLCAVAEVTGDLSLLREQFAPDQLQLFVPGAGLGAEAQAEARALAAAALDAHLAAGHPAGRLEPARLQEVYAFLTGSPRRAERWGEFLTEELAPVGTDPRRPSWHTGELGQTFRCAVIGAGASGIAAAHRLRQAGVAVTIFEKNAEVGGTWFENVYPGCRVDVPNRLYSFSFAQSNDWVSQYSAQPELLDYLRRVAVDSGVHGCIRFSSEVTEARFDDETAHWALTVRGDDGTEQTEQEFDAVVCAVGQLNRPSFPAIEGREQFRGPWFHSALWDDSVALAGRRVAVIGTGASAAQFIPLIADDVVHLDVYQRTAPWMMPTANYGDPLPAPFGDLVTVLPGFGRWERLWQFWLLHEGMLSAARVDPEWDLQTEAVSAANDAVRSMLVDVLRAQVADDELFEKMVPHFPPFAKRALRDDGRWVQTMEKPHVDLVTTPIERITPGGVRTVDGIEHRAEVLIYGTGFRASGFVAPMRVHGRKGVELNEEWGGDARAYLGITVPGFPNFFMLYGPNTNLVINGSILVMVECQVRYVVEAIGALLQSGHRTMSCRPEVHERYAEEMDDGNGRMVWGVADVPSWYRNERGTVTQNWPLDLHTYWERTKEPDLSDFDLA